MYAKHFGLKRRIFQGNAAGEDVFVGPQTASILSGIRKAFAAPDAVVIVTGPVGSGKSTAVAHALGAIGGKNAVVRVGRFPLRRGEILDLLFDHMRIQQRPPRGNQKLALFRQLLFNLDKNDSRMFILVEDAPFLGDEILSELEVLTAADTGPSDGANIVLMGDESLRELASSRALARMRQRVRLRRKLDPCSVEEMAGYLRHCFRQAGGEFDHIFDRGATAELHTLSGGILRVVNNLVEASMEAAVDLSAQSVDADLVRRVADEEFGLSGEFSALPEIADPEPVPEISDDATANLVACSLPEIEAAPDAAPQTGAAKTQPEPEDVIADPGEAAEVPELIEDTLPSLAKLPEAGDPDTVPELIQDTLPDLRALPPEPDRALSVSESPGQPQAAAADGSSTEPEAAIPTLGDSATSPRAGDDKPDWDKDPTFAELRPDLDALERAMAVAQGRDAEAADEAPQEEPPPPAEEKQDETVAELPEITLDDSINRKVDRAALERKQRDEEAGEVSDDEDDDAREAELEEQRAAAELEKIAAGLAQAKTIEDVDDKMAETLFGEELSIAAAAVAKKVAEESAPSSAAAPEPQAETVPAEPGPAANDGRSPMEREFENVWGEQPAVEVSIESQFEGQTGGLDLSASQRLATVRALNTDGNSKKTSKPAGNPQSPPAKDPEPIEEQITTSMTQTMKALNVKPAPSVLNDDDDDSRKGSFFNRFRRS